MKLRNNWSLQFKALFDFTTFPVGWVGVCFICKYGSASKLMLKLSWVELRLSLAKMTSSTFFIFESLPKMKWNEPTFKLGQNQVVNRWDVVDDVVVSVVIFVDVVGFVVVILVFVIVVDPINLPLKFGWNRVSNSCDIADIEFVWVVGGGGWWWWVVVD